MTKQINPVQGLVEYTTEVKPYHSKIVEVLVDYIHTDLVGINIVDNLKWNFIFDADYSSEYCTTAGFGVLPYGDYNTIDQQPLRINVLSVDIINNRFDIAGNFTHFANIGNSLNIQGSSYGHNGNWLILNMSYNAILHITTVTVDHLMNSVADGAITSISTNSYPIIRTDVTNKLLIINSNFSSDFHIGDITTVGNSTGNDGDWTITSVFYHLLEDATVLGLEFQSITQSGGLADGQIITYAQSNFDLPEECPFVAPNTARTFITEELDFVQGSTLYFWDFIDVEMQEPMGIVPWSGEVYGWDIAGFNTEWPSFITITEHINETLGVIVNDNVATSDIFETPWLAQYATEDIGWDQSAWDNELGTEWSPDFAPNIAPHAISTDFSEEISFNLGDLHLRDIITDASIIDILQVQGNFAGAYDYQSFDIGPFD